MNEYNKLWALKMLRAVQSVLEEEEDFRTDRGAGEALETVICMIEEGK